MPAEKNENRLKEMILREKPTLIILGIKNAREKKYASVLAKEANCTYSHTIKILQELNDLGIVESKKDGRTKYIQLTPKGEDVAYALESLNRVLSKAGE